MSGSGELLWAESDRPIVLLADTIRPCALNSLFVQPETFRNARFGCTPNPIVELANADVVRAKRINTVKIVFISSPKTKKAASIPG